MPLFKRCVTCQHRYVLTGRCRDCGQPLCYECDGSWRGGYSPGFGLCEACKEEASRQAVAFVNAGGLAHIRSAIVVSQVASQLAGKVLEETLRQGHSVEIPSLGITIRPDHLRSKEQGDG